MPNNLFKTTQKINIRFFTNTILQKWKRKLREKQKKMEKNKQNTHTHTHTHIHIRAQHEEMFYILHHKGNANQNNIEILTHPSQNGYY
jgi:hypothetical protein